MSEGSILDETIHDPIMLEDITVRDYLRENKTITDTDDKNIIFMQGNLLVGVNRKTIKQIIMDNDASSIKYPCHNVGVALFITPDLVENIPFFSNRLIGLYGMTFLSHIKYVIEHPEVTAVKLVEDPNIVPAVATASLNMLSRFANAVGAAHCQAGTDERIYSLVNISPGTGETTSIEPGETSSVKRKSRHAMRHTKKQRKINRRKTKKPKKINRGKTKKQY